MYNMEYITDAIVSKVSWKLDATVQFSVSFHHFQFTFLRKRNITKTLLALSYRLNI